MEITYDYYRIFYYVAKYKSFSKAATILMGSQPNISRFMSNLESQPSSTFRPPNWNWLRTEAWNMES